MDYISVLAQIVGDEPSITYGDALKIIKKKGWLFDFGSLNLEQLEAPAWRVLTEARFLMIQAERAASATPTVSYQQYLQTGQASTIRDLLNPTQIQDLLYESDRYHQLERKPPLTLSALSGQKTFHSSLAVNVAEKVLNDSQINVLNTREFTLLSDRCMLRRTFHGTYDLNNHGNINNQAWHQDSNPSFDGRPMLTLWIPLQDGCSISRPGLELSGLTPPSFNRRLGDSCSTQDLKAFYQVSNIHSFVPSDISAGDCLAFNGLTFHRTYVTSNMNSTRDVLLIRLCAAIDSDYFPGDQSSRLTFTI